MKLEGKCIKNVLIVVAFCVSCFCSVNNSPIGVVAASTNLQNWDSLLGLSVSEVLARLNLSPDSYTSIEEPPSIGRGVILRDNQGDEFWLYVARGDVPQKFDGKWSLSEFLHKQVIGIAVEKGGSWKISGKVIPYFHMGKSRIGAEQAK